MTVAHERRRWPAPPDPPKEARCNVCGGWVVTVPADAATWVRARCFNDRVDPRKFDGRKCPAYGRPQQMRLE